jgi:hypothetical protein
MINPAPKTKNQAPVTEAKVETPAPIKSEQPSQEVTMLTAKVNRLSHDLDLLQ